MRRAPIPLTAVLCLILVVGTVSGCGGSESEPEAVEETTTTAETAHEEYIVEGDALCSEFQVEAGDLARQAQEIQAQRGTVPDEEFIDLTADLWGDQIEVVERFRDRLADLDPPDEDEPRVEEFLASLDEGIEIARQIKASLDGGEEPPQTLLQSYEATAARGNMQAQDFGFQVCGSG